MWLLDLAAKLPETVELDGLDISFNAAPPAQTLPSNVSFYEWDIRKPVPQELKGVYDLVHIRTFSFVLQEDELPLVLEHLLDLLSKELPPLKTLFLTLLPTKSDFTDPFFVQHQSLVATSSGANPT